MGLKEKITNDGRRNLYKSFPCYMGGGGSLRKRHFDVRIALIEPDGTTNLSSCHVAPEDRQDLIEFLLKGPAKKRHRIRRTFERKPVEVYCHNPHFYVYNWLKPSDVEEVWE